MDPLKRVGGELAALALLKPAKGVAGRPADMRKPRQRNERRTKAYTLGITITEEEDKAVEKACTDHGYSRTELVRAALRLDDPIKPRPLLVAAGALVQASHAFAAALERNDLRYAATTLRELEDLTRTMIRLETERRLRR